MLNYFKDLAGGSSRLAYDEAIFLAEQGNDVWIIAQDIARRRPEHCVENNIHVLRYPSPQYRLFDPRRIFGHQQEARRLLLKYLDDKVDLVHGHTLLGYDGALDIYRNNTRTCYSVHSPVRLEMLASCRKQPYLHRIHPLITAFVANRIEKKCMTRSHVTTAFSEYTRTTLKKIHGTKTGDQTQMIPGWVDLEKFNIIQDRKAAKLRLGLPTDVPILFTLRRLVPRMGLDNLIYALQKVRAENRSFLMLIAGSGPLRNNLQELVDKLDLSSCVRFLGYVDDSDLPLLYGASDTFVLPTAELECFGIIALEALACGTPVLATPVGAIPEIINRFEPTWLAKNNSPLAIAELIKTGLDGELPFHSPSELREIVRTYYSKEIVLRQLVDVALRESTR